MVDCLSISVKGFREDQDPRAGVAAGKLAGVALGIVMLGQPFGQISRLAGVSFACDLTLHDVYEIDPPPRVGDEHSAKLNQNQGFSEPTTRKTTRGIPKGWHNLHPGRAYAVDGATTNHMHNMQNSKESLDVDRLSTILKLIPAEYRADFLRFLADRIDGKTS
jgi:hypothetical protein